MSYETGFGVEIEKTEDDYEINNWWSENKHDRPRT